MSLYYHGPRATDRQPLNSQTERTLVIVEERHAARLRELVVDFLRSGRPADRHPVVDVVGAQRQPFVQAALVEQARFAIQEFLCLESQQHALLQVEVLERGHQTTPDGAGECCAISSCQLSACIHSCQL